MSVKRNEALELNERAFSKLSMGKIDEAEKLFVQATKTDKNYVPPLCNLAAIYNQKGKYGKAVRTIKKALKLDGNHSPSISLYGELLLMKRKFEAAKAVFEDGFVKTKEPIFLASIGNCWACLNEKKLATENYKKAFSMGEKNYKIAQSIGVVYMEEGNPTEAEKWLIEAYSLEPRDEKTIELLIACNMQLSNTAKALEWVEKLKKLNPNNATAQQMGAMLSIPGIQYEAGPLKTR